MGRKNCAVIMLTSALSCSDSLCANGVSSRMAQSTRIRWRGSPNRSLVFDTDDVEKISRSSDLSGG